MMKLVQKNIRIDEIETQVNIRDGKCIFAYKNQIKKCVLYVDL